MSSRIDSLLNKAVAHLQASSALTDEGYRLDAELLLCHVIGQPRSYLFTWPEKELGTSDQIAFRKLVEQRATGIPVAYLTGTREFWSLTLKVNDQVLIPRPDTELIVELALSRQLRQNAVIADLGTGSGAIALALAGEKPDWQVLAVDQSHGALATAQENARFNHINNVSFLAGSWCQPLADKKLDMIVTNPPYIREDDHHLTQGDVRFEPRSALASGKDGLEDIRQIVCDSRNHLPPGGWLLIEHGYDQGQAVAELMTGQGYIEVVTKQDLAGHDRVTMGQLMG
ncbi:peptide chain release factor N(5)-glutamine methyltransferase [Endozoicomonas sp. Mp262]|uniref:peptide chain release factor N(5)-glutamine methyltransferase n=1 Tax=Endozoicomonas sp. Mp262 TaxID=2919499 RepID=UPI0021E09BC6